MQNYSKIQKFISFLLIFSILFSFTINIKFFWFVGTIFAADTKNYNLVSIFVQEDIYGDIDNEVEQYARNIQNTLENTKTIIIPTDSEEHPFNIASVNEKLYFEWQEGLLGSKGNSKLVWSVFIWNLPLPVVENNGAYEKTVVPYVDFEDKAYIYNHTSKKFELNKDAQNDPKAEIWQGFISPNTGDLDKDITQIKDYFAKNNDYYNGVWNFKVAEGMTNGKDSDELDPKYQPYVFYYDQIRETKAVRYVDYKWYEWYLDNIEDITYNRFSSELAEKLKEVYFWEQQKYIGDVSSIIGTWSQISASLLWPTTKNIPDIQNRHVIQNTSKRFLQIFNESTLWDFRKDVHNAGRYNSGSSIVNVDLIPSLVSSVDAVSQSVLKNVNTDLEWQIDTLVKKWLSRDIAIPSLFEVGGDDYTNILYWLQAKDITSAAGCTIFRGSTYGSGQLTEANRAFNINNVSPDLGFCNKAETQWYWWGNSPVNLNTSASTVWGSIWQLKFQDYSNAIHPLYDINGALKNTNISNNPDPRNCFNNNFILTEAVDIDGNVTYRVPINGKSKQWWGCTTTNSKLGYTYDFDYTFKNFPTLSVAACETHTLYLDGVQKNNYSNLDCATTTDPVTWSSSTASPTSKIYNFHKINSWIEHKAPTADDVYKQTQYMISPNLPIDKDRYIDFIAADNSYGKINYPYLFRLWLDQTKEFNLENARTSLKTYLDKKSQEINTLISAKNPSKLGGTDATIFGFLSTGTYPQANVDLYKALENKPDQEVEVMGTKKKISYIDTLIFSVYWNNLNSVSAKYKFIVENYLSDQFGGNGFNFYLPKNKKQYEISYMWAPWDAKNMYVKLDPEDKWENPYADTMAANANLNNFLLSTKGSWAWAGWGNFKCAPPEWVPIWQWIPAVMCRLQDMVPPKVSIGTEQCWISLLSSKDDGSFIDSTDANKNGISDALERELKNGSIDLKADSTKYYYNSLGKLDASLLNASGSVISFDSISNIKFELLKLEIPQDQNNPISDTNKKVIFDKTNIEKSSLNDDAAYNEAMKYISFRDISIRVQNGKASYSFVSKATDANVTFKASITLKDQKGKVVIQKEDTKDVQIRGDLFYATNYNLSNFLGEETLDSGLNSVRASESNNIFLVEDSTFNSLKANLSSLRALSSSEDKLFVTLANKDKKGNQLPIAYPLVVKLTDENGKVVDQQVLNTLPSTYNLWSFKSSGTFHLEIKDKFWFLVKKEIEILPWVAVKIDPSLSTSLIEKDWVITTNVFTIYDKYGNPTVWDTYDVSVNISGGSVVFDDGLSKRDFSVYEWYKPFRLKTTDKSGPSSISFRLKKDGKLLDEKNLSISVVDKIQFEVVGLPSQIKVWNNSYDFDLKILNAHEWAKFNSRAYLVTNNSYIVSNTDYIDIKNNFWTGSFSTKTKAWEKINLEFKIEWVKESVYKEIDILPDLPIKVDLSLSKSKIEADKNASSYLYVDLKDRYGNVVWNDNSTNLTLEIAEKYKHILKSTDTNNTVTKWKSSFILNGTNIPGTAFFKVSTSPSLSNNKIEIIGQTSFPKTELDSISGMRSAWVLTEQAKLFFEEYDLSSYRFKYLKKDALQQSGDFKDLPAATQTALLTLFDKNNKIVVSWIGENAGKIETFYFWNKSKIEGRKYNALYTTLLWAGYGDITTPDNVSNSLIFDKGNKSLVVTSLLNTLEKTAEVVNINPNGSISLNYSSTDLSQDISSTITTTKDNKLQIEFFNNTFNSLVSTLFINLKDVALSDCSSTDINACLNTSTNKAALKINATWYEVTGDDSDRLILKNSEGKKLLEITQAGEIFRADTLNLVLSNTLADGLVLDVKDNGKVIGNLLITLSNDSKINFIREISNLDATLASQTYGGIIAYLEGKDYYFTQKYLWNSTKAEKWYTISYNDPFKTDSGDISTFGSNFPLWYESFLTDKAIGWEEDNKTLLSFAAGKHVWDATKDYMTFSLINLWDPVVTLKPITKNIPGTPQHRKFDSGIWYLISKDEDNLAYNIFDYNKDGITDIVILKRNGYVQLLEWTADIKHFLDRGNLAYLADLSKKAVIETGDFNADGYADIVVLNKNREPILLNNNKKDFTRVNLDLKLKWIISQIISYDMDLDGKHDLITLDDSWEINISYGTSTVWAFTKLKVDTVGWVTLNNTPRKDGWAVYYDGLYQIPADKTQDYITESKELLKADQSGVKNEGNEFNEGMVDKLLFTQMTYGNIQGGEAKDNVVSALPDLSTLNKWGLNVDNSAITNFVNNTSEELNPGWNLYDQPNSNNVVTLLKSEYAEYEGIDIEKTYIDENGAPLKWMDKVQLKIKVTNNSAKALNDFVYVDKVQQTFDISENPDYTLNIWGKEIAKEDIELKASPSDEFTFMLDSYKDGANSKKITLNPGESLYFTIYLDTRAFEFWHMEAWLFDTTTPHGDIVFKTKNENCGKPFDLYKSTAVRTYEKEQKAGVCKNDLPDGIKENAVDTDKNGVPDYIDKLVNGASSGSTVQNYAKDKLNDFNKDTDKDGLTDREEISPHHSNEDDFMNSLWDVDVNVDGILEWIDTILAGLSCWFGWGWCIAAPINRAPLAPGQDLAAFGLPLWDGLNIDEWLPIFSALTWAWYGPWCWPAIWPPSFLTSEWCWSNSAGWRLWIKSAWNFIRIFITPTLTGAVWLAVCLWWPAKAFWQIPPKWVTPFVPGWNCIIAAAPMFGCKNDGSDGEMPKMWLPGQTVMNGNCSWDDNTGATPPYLGSVAKDYMKYKKTGQKPTSLKDALKGAFSKVASRGKRWDLPSQPLLNVAGASDGDLQVDVDFSALKSGNFSDVLKINMTRISPFPDFIMEWVTRQIEEIANKLTDFPTLYVILPDFGNVFDNGFWDFIDKLKKSYNEWEKNADIQKDKLAQKIEKEKAEQSKKDCEKDSIGCLVNDIEVTKLTAEKDLWTQKATSWIKAAYEFMSNMPIISIQTQKVNFNLPWIDKKTAERAIANFQITKKQREEELARAKWEWKLDNYNCVWSQAQEWGCKVAADTQGLIYSIDKNIEILNEYKRLPEKVHKMLKIKEIRISQILCNLETISKITGWRIWDNGKRFKAWVELYVLIKAILKSWQLLIDVFVDYSAECHQCKNERYDLMYYIWKLISAAMPKIPIIKFPKWPDIYLDLHGIRVNLVIGLPEFEFNLRPIVIPPLPKLYLPNSPSLGIKLPTLPLLPKIILGELPDLPSLPKIELPNLPPPPKLPKLLASIEAFLNILKIITKVMCILKTSPFVPEIRAWDQIAFITERSGYLSLDFLDISLPQFSFPFVDAIKVTTYVNLEFEVEFLVEMARQNALPLNIFTNNIANMLNIGLGDLDFRDALPINDINVKMEWDNGLQKTKDIELNPMKAGSYNFDKNAKISLYSLAKVLARNILKVHETIEKDGKIEVSNETFKQLIASQLKNIQNEKILGTWKQALNYSFTKEDELIKKLIDNNEAKFNEVKSILNEEKVETNKIMSELEQKLEQWPTPNTLISATTSATQDYNTRLEKYKLSAQQSIKNLFVPDSEVQEIRQESQKVLQEVKTGLDNFSQKLWESQQAFENVKVNNPKASEASQTVQKDEQILALNTTQLLADATTASWSATTTASGSCGNAIGGYSYIYKWIYVVEEYLSEKISYLLFDYTDELGGKEVFKEADFDGDSDEDIIYMVDNEIYIKENFNANRAIEHYTGNPTYVDSDDNMFYSNNAIEAVNGLRESISDNSYINVSFLNATNSKVSNYQLEFYDIVDKYSDVANGLLSSYIPTEVKKYVIDAFRDIDDITVDSEVSLNNSVTIRKNLAYINSVGNLAGVNLTTKELRNLKDDVQNNAEITINAGTKVYAASDGVKITYYLYKERNNELKLKEIVLSPHTNIEFKDDTVIVWVNSDAYVEGRNMVTLTGNSIIPYVKKPLLPGAKIEYLKNEVSANVTSYVWIRYFDGSETDIDFDRIKYYELYDLWIGSDSYLVRTGIENNFYYGKIRTFKQWLYSTYSNQILLSPQKESDNKAPEIDNFSALKVPVYQKKIIDVWEYIFEDSGLKNITQIYIDFDLEKDSNNNGNLYDDKDYEMWKSWSWFDISIEWKKILFNIGPFDKLYNKKIRLSIVDDNKNTGYKDVSFIVYPPIPKIESLDTSIGWKLNESLLKEPVNFYKLRGGNIEKISDKNDNDTTDTFDSGKFNFEVGGKSWSWLIFTSSWETMFKVNEETWKIELSDFDKAKYGITYTVYSSNNKANDKAYPKVVVSKWARDIYYQYLSLPNTGKVEVVSDFAWLKEQWIYYKHNSNLFSYYQIPLGVTQNPWDLFIYSSTDINKERLFTLFKDGRINTQNELYYLEYDSYDKYVVYNLRKAGMDDIIGKVMIIPEKNFILR